MHSDWQRNLLPERMFRLQKRKLRGAWVISNWEKKELRELKMKLKKEAVEHEACERALYEHLKKKYG